MKDDVRRTLPQPTAADYAAFALEAERWANNARNDRDREALWSLAMTYRLAAFRAAVLECGGDEAQAGKDQDDRAAG